MAEFIHEQTSITTHAYVFQSLSTETYARGAIIVDSKPKLKRICQFITNPNHFIVSNLSGRPWVIDEDMLRAGTFNINLHILQPKSKNINMGSKLMASIQYKLVSNSVAGVVKVQEYCVVSM